MCEEIECSRRTFKMQNTVTFCEALAASFPAAEVQQALIKAA